MIPIRLDCTHAIPKNADSPKNRHTQLNMSTPEHHQHKRKRDHDNDEKEEREERRVVEENNTNKGSTFKTYRITAAIVTVSI